MTGLLLVVPAGGHRGAPAICPSTAVLAGHGASVAMVGSALHQRGIERTRARGCAPLRVTVARCEGGLRLGIVRPGGRTAERVVATAETAAAVIESWLRTDIAAPLLAVHAIEQPEIPSPLTASGEEEGDSPSTTASFGGDEVVATLDDDDAQLPPPASSPFSLAMLGQGARVKDGSTGWGVAVAACAVVGRACIGVTGRFERIWPVAGPGEPAAGVDRVAGYAADGLIGVEVALSLGRATLRPGAGVGYGWRGTRGLFFDHRAYSNDFGPRAETRLAVSWPLWGALGVEVGVSLGAGAATTVARIPGASATSALLLSREMEPVMRGGIGVRYGGAAP